MAVVDDVCLFGAVCGDPLGVYLVAVIVSFITVPLLLLTLLAAVATWREKR